MDIRHLLPLVVTALAVAGAAWCQTPAGPVKPGEIVFRTDFETPYVEGLLVEAMSSGRTSRHSSWSSQTTAG